MRNESTIKYKCPSCGAVGYKDNSDPARKASDLTRGRNVVFLLQMVTEPKPPGQLATVQSPWWECPQCGEMVSEDKLQRAGDDEPLTKYQPPA